jgi:hypothetical protein
MTSVHAERHEWPVNPCRKMHHHALVSGGNSIHGRCRLYSSSIIYGKDEEK